MSGLDISWLTKEKKTKKKTNIPIFSSLQALPLVALAGVLTMWCVCWLHLFPCSPQGQVAVWVNGLVGGAFPQTFQAYRRVAWVPFYLWYINVTLVGDILALPSPIVYQGNAHAVLFCYSVIYMFIYSVLFLFYFVSPFSLLIPLFIYPFIYTMVTNETRNTNLS